MPRLDSEQSTVPAATGYSSSSTAVLDPIPTRNASMDVRAGLDALIEEAQRACMAPAPGDEFLDEAAPAAGQGPIKPASDCAPGEIIVIGIDGTGSAEWRANPASTGPQFVEEIVGKYPSSPANKFYHDGPSNGAQVPWTRGENQHIVDAAVAFATERHAACPDNPIHAIGYSRGGFDVMQAAAKLGKGGVPIDKMINLDPVDMDIGFGDTDQIPANVRSATVVVAAPSELEIVCEPFAGCVVAVTDGQSRPYFHRPDADAADPSATKVTKYVTRATHAAIGGTPGTGDHPIGFTQERDDRLSREVRREMYDAAISAGARLTMPPELMEPAAPAAR